MTMIAFPIAVAAVASALGVAAAIAAVGYALLLYWEHRRMSGIPGPPRSSFITGHLSDITERRKRGAIFEEIRFQWHLQYGYTIAIFIFHKALVSCIDPDIIRKVLLQHPREFPKGTSYSRIGFLFRERGLGEGLVTQRDYDSWAMQRLAINPAFHKRFLVSLVSKFNDTAEKMVEQLGSFCDSGQSIDLAAYFHQAAHDVISQIILGMPASDFYLGGHLMKSAIGLLNGFSVGQKTAFPNWSPWLYKERKEYIESVRVIKAAAKEAVKKRIAALQSEGETAEDILSVIVKEHVKNPQFTMDLVLDNVVTFFVAGQETTAHTLAFVFFYLSSNPDAMQKLIKEIQDLVRSSGTAVSYEDTCSMTYCTAVIKETLRLNPVAPGTVRHLSDGLTHKTVKIPPACDIFFSAYSSGRHPDFHKDSAMFNPERFEGDQARRIPAVNYFPFSLGPRSCIGQNFAMLEMKIIIAKFLERFRYDMDASKPFRLHQNPTLQPYDGLWVTLRDR